MKLLALSALAFFAAGAFAQVQSYDLAADFSFANNPNGAWSFGSFDASVNDPFVPLTQVVDPFGIGSAWVPSATGRPVVGVLSTDFADATQGTPYLHPGIPGSEPFYSVVRWTAPSDGVAVLAGKFYDGDGGRTDDLILVNGTLLGAVSVFDSATGFSFGGVRNVTAGTTLDYVVGSGTDGANFDTTPLDLHIDFTPSNPVPEPASLAALGLGAIGLLRRRARR